MEFEMLCEKNVKHQNVLCNLIQLINWCGTVSECGKLIKHETMLCSVLCNMGNIY